MTQAYYPNPFHNGGDVTEVEYEKFATSYIVDGIYSTSAVPPSDAPLVFGDTSGRQVKFRANTPAFVRGGIWSSDATVTVAVAANASGSTRIDLATLRLDRSASVDPVCSPHVITGTPGSGAPAPVQNAAGSGVWDLPLAEITVRSGVSTINAADVTFDCWYLGAATLVKGSSFANAPRAAGRLLWRSDVGRMFVDTGSGDYPVVYEDTGWVNATAISGSGWNQGIKFRRLNGVVYTQFGAFTRTGGTLAPSTPTRIATAPAGFRPTASTHWLCYFNGAELGMGFIDSLGAVFLTAYGATTINTGQVLTPADIAYPAAFASA